MSTIIQICSTERQVYPFITIKLPLPISVHFFFFMIKRDQTFILDFYVVVVVKKHADFAIYIAFVYLTFIWSWLVTTFWHSSLSLRRYICATTICQDLPLRVLPTAREPANRTPGGFALKFSIVVSRRSTYCSLPSTGYCNFNTQIIQIYYRKDIEAK